MVLRNNKSLSYFLFICAPITLSASLFSQYIYDTARIRTARILNAKVMDWSALTLILVAMSLTVSAAFKRIDDRNSAFVPYDHYADFLKSIMKPEDTCIGDHRFWFGLRENRCALLWYEYEVGWMKNKELDSLADYGWLFISDDQTRRFKGPKARAFVRDHFDRIADITVYPYGHTAIYRNKRRPVSGGYETLQYPVSATYTGEKFLVTSQKAQHTETLHPEQWRLVSQDAAMQMKNDGLELTTGTAPYGYQLESPVSQETPPSHLVAAVDLTVDVSSGGGSLGLLSEDRSQWFANSRFDATGTHSMRLMIPDGQSYYMVFQNCSPNKTASRYTIRSLEKKYFPYVEY